MLNGANAATNDFVDMWSQKTWLLMTLSTCGHRRENV